MKYATAERHNAYQGELMTEEQFTATSDDWEAAMTAYENRLKEVNDKFPPSVLKFLDTVRLHDATFDPWACFSLSNPDKVELVIKQDDWGDHKFVCVLRYRVPHPGHYAKVTGEYYNMVDQKIHDGPGFYRPKFDPENPPPPHVVAWLYDEFDYIGSTDGHDIFSHSFLLSNGVEYTIHFSEFSFMYLPVGPGFVEV